MARALPRTAVFIDGDWFRYASHHLIRTIPYDRLLALLRDYFGGPTIAYFYASFNCDRPEDADLLSTLRDIGYDVEAFPLLRTPTGPVSKGVDVALAVRAASQPP